MPDTNDAPKQKDSWDKLDIIAKGILAIAIPGTLAWYGYYTEAKRAEDSEKNRNAQVLVQALTHREGVEADLKAKMFATLIEHYFKGQPQMKVEILELMALNFKDQFTLRPLFEKLNSATTNDQDKRELRRVARSIAGREITTIVGAGGQVCEVDLKIGRQSIPGCLPLPLTLKDVKEDRVQVSTKTDGKDPLEVSYFDTPFVDNTTINAATYSLVLSDTSERDASARIRIVIFPPFNYSVSNRLHVDQLMGKYLAPSVEQLGK